MMKRFDRQILSLQHRATERVYQFMKRCGMNPNIRETFLPFQIYNGVRRLCRENPRNMELWQLKCALLARQISFLLLQQYCRYRQNETNLAMCQKLIGYLRRLIILEIRMEIKNNFDVLVFGTGLTDGSRYVLEMGKENKNLLLLGQLLCQVDSTW
jgi:hypothetical protein